MEGQVGMMLSGNVIDNILIGGPAYNSQHAKGKKSVLAKGDVIVAVS